ncbi:MAG: Nif3-like dinuclear metal center hexameric protein [Anaerolineae bacterium]|nr:Nif3-like dinuclear metal center hexameric protein [Anaerolineae bacterium]
MIARDLDLHMRSVATWVAWDNGTCDGFKYGDPDTMVTGIAVAWQSQLSALKEARACGCNLFVTHEPTFYAHMDDDQALLASEPAVTKQKFLDDAGMVVYRCHDVWDVIEGEGVIDRWVARLELGPVVAGDRYHRVIEVPTVTAWELASQIGQRVSALDEQTVAFIGERSTMVHRLGVGTGAITDVRKMVDMGADAVLVTDDGVLLWREGAWLADLGIPAMVVNHTTAEIPGLLGLEEHLRRTFDGVPVHFVGQRCGYEILNAGGTREQLIRMRRDTLDDLPPVELPEGYRLASMREHEVKAYLQVVNESLFAGEIGEPWFNRTFRDDPLYHPAHIQLIWHGDTPVAGAAAWHTTVGKDPYGMVHWVGVRRQERGKGLGKAITLATLRRLRERGYQQALLDTNPWRLQAVAAYLRLGFRPWATDDMKAQLWERTLEDLERWRLGGTSSSR